MEMNQSNQAKFKSGSEVQLVSDSTRIGVVVELDCLHGGVWFYMVNFGGDRKVVPETDLIPYRGPRYPLTLKSFVLQKGAAEKRDLVNAPFTQIHPQGIRGIFKPNEIDEILRLTERIEIKNEEG